MAVLAAAVASSPQVGRRGGAVLGLTRLPPPRPGQPAVRRRHAGTGVSAVMQTADQASASANANARLWAALVEAAGRKQAEAARSALQVVERVSRVAGPRPDWLPPGPAGDSVLSLASDPLGFITSTASTYGDVAGFTLAGERVVLISDPQLAHEALVTHADVLVKAGTALFPGSSLTGDGLLVSDGELWRRQRRLSNPAFRQAAVDSYAQLQSDVCLCSHCKTGAELISSVASFQAIVGATEAMLRTKWGNGTVRDVYSDFNELTMSAVAAALFGIDIHDSNGVDADNGNINGQIGPAIATAFRCIWRRATDIVAAATPEWVPTPDNVRFTAAVDQLDAIVYDIIARRRREMQTLNGPPKNPDLLWRLMLARDEEDEASGGMEDKALRDEVLTLLIAGQETSAILLAWVCASLAQDSKFQSAIAAQARDVASGRGSFTHADVPSLPLAEAAILEAMRLLPPAWMVGRAAAQDVDISSNLHIKQGTSVFVSPYVLHRDARRWELAEEFVPSRWLDADTGGIKRQELRDNDSYIPFGVGPRICIGMRFAMLETVLILATLLRDYELRLPSGASFPQPAAIITLRPAQGVELELVARTE
eukprot:jgi/Chlat1/7389/Chrsp6S07422